jgi:predicted GNAT family N-acyltransferase
MSAPFEIRLHDWAEARPAARAVREDVFIREQKVPRELEWDEWDERCVHALALEPDGRPVGTARLLPDGRLGRMAVLSAWRGRGAGTALALALIRRAAEQGCAMVILHAQLQAAPFYRRLGFTERGATFEEAGIPHVEMTLELGPVPAPHGS